MFANDKDSRPSEFENGSVIESESSDNIFKGKIRVVRKRSTETNNAKYLEDLESI